MSTHRTDNGRICLECGNHDLPGHATLCPVCGSKAGQIIDFRNSDDRLLHAAPRLMEERCQAGLEDLVGGLEFVVINTEPEHQRGAVEELLARTGLHVTDAFEDSASRAVVLQSPGSADVLVTSRKGASPFAAFTDYPKSRHLPTTRLETFAFSCRDVAEYERIQRSRDIEFMSDAPVSGRQFKFIQTTPSPYTGISIGLIERSGSEHSYRLPESVDLDWHFEKPALAYLGNIGRLDHTATRVRAKERDEAILEFINLTNYRFEFAIYVKSLNSITNVARLSANDFAMVFTSGIAPFADLKTSGPTERFTHNYGPRTHHLAWDTEAIDEVFAGLVDDGQQFLLDLVGSPDEGLKQTFSVMSPHTLLINEYIHRFGEFDGFFTKSNVTLLTEATGTQ